jgi:hypothetical protein
MEDAMQRMFIFAMAMWLGSLAAANAQTATQPSAPRIGQPLPQAGVAATAMDNSSSLLMSQQSASTGATSSLDTTSSAISATASDPLGVPTSTLPSGQATTGSVAIGAISASSTINPQRAVQLPGEAANNSTQAPTTSATASSGGAAAGTSSNNAACSTAIPTTTGELSVGGLFSAGSPGGC